MNPNYGTLDVNYDNRFIRFEDHTAYESRNPAMIRLLKEAWELRIRGSESTPVKFFKLFTDDVYNPYCHYSFSSRCAATARRSMPSFVFDSWPECGIPSYEDMFFCMLESGDKPHKDDRIFWIGNASMNVKAYDSRRMAISISASRPDLFDFREIRWNRVPNQVDNTAGYVSLPCHCRYRVLIDFSAVGFSARVPLLLASGRPLMLMDRIEEAWFYWDGSLVPWVHYIPFSNNLESLISVSRWTFENQEECETIGRRGRSYALRHFTRTKAVERLGEMLVKHDQHSA